MRDGIKLYEVDGEALDNAWIAKNRDMLDRHVVDDMRANGYIPVLDIDPEFTSVFDPEKETFKFTVGIYAYYMGDKSEEYMGIIYNDGILISRDQKKVMLYDAEGI